MRCPNCGTVNSISARVCECGHDLQSGDQQDDYEESWTSRNEGWVGCGVLVLVVVMLMWVGGCFVSGRDPVNDLARNLSRFPQYSIIVNDAKDGFFRNTLVLESIIMERKPVGEEPSEGEGEEKEKAEDLFNKNKQEYTVSQRVLDRYIGFIGMVVSSKSADGKITGYKNAYPPGYNYIGRSRYGYWGPRHAWIWYPSYRRYWGPYYGSHVVYRSNYGRYVSARGRGQAYYGPNSARPTFGSRGSVTKTSRPAFYKNYQSRQSTARSGSRSGSSSRGGGFFSRSGK